MDATTVTSAVTTTSAAMSGHGTDASTNEGSPVNDPSSDCAPTQPYAIPSTSPTATAVTVSCAASAMIILRTCPPVKPRVRSRPSSRCRCSTANDRLLTMPVTATTAENPMRMENTPTATARTSCIPSYAPGL